MKLSIPLVLASAASLGAGLVHASPVSDQVPLQAIFASSAAAHGSNSVISELYKQVASTLSAQDLVQLLVHIESLPELRTLVLDEAGTTLAVTEGEKALLTYLGIKYDDVTDFMDAVAATSSPVAVLGKKGPAKGYPAHFAYGKDKLEKDVYKSIDTSRMLERLKKFTSFRTRYYRSDTGKQSQRWLKETVESIAKSNDDLGITVKEFPHPWGQNSIIATLPAAGGAENSKGKIVIGAHQDSTNLLPFLAAPGADDDGSGTVTVLEVMTNLVQREVVPGNYSIEFHWYSAEEGGMLGSNAIVADYQSRLQAGSLAPSEHVRAMLQMDMTAYIKPGTKERIGIIQDFVDPELTGWIEGLIKEYNDIPSVPSKCGYACSDHSSWTKIGVPSAFAIEATFEDSNTRNIHTSGDTVNVDGFSLDHMKQFVKLATAFVLELSE